MTTPEELGAAAREWTTAVMPMAEQFTAWERTVNDAFVPVSIRPSSPGSFVSGVRVRAVGGVDIADMVSDAQSVERTSDAARTSPGEVYFLNLPLHDGTSAAQDGRVARLRRSDFAIVDGDRPFALSFESPFRQVSLKIPRELIERRVRRPQDVVGRRIAGDVGMGAIASAAIRATADAMATLNQRSARVLGDRIADLVALAVGDASTQQDVEPMLWSVIRDATERMLDDPELTPALVADRVGISVRHLHRVFADNGPSFGRWVLGRRLELAFADLVDPGLRLRPVAQVARDRGFADPSYFSRAFRLRYDLTPRELRAAAARRDSSASSE
jgi:AraC-like DNA-binding protein